MMSSLHDLSDLRICILGGGQLGWMTILEGRKYPLTFYVVDEPDAPACRIADKCYDPRDYRYAVDSSDIVTFEFEHVHSDALNYADERGKLLPRLSSVVLKRERWLEKEFYRKHNIATPKFYIHDDLNEVISTVKNEFNYYTVIKRSRGGYDGKGQYFIKSKEDLERCIDVLSKVKDVLIVEELVDFDFEASLIAVRNNSRFTNYPPTYNYNEGGILIYNYGPLAEDGIVKKMVEITKKISDTLNYVGVIGVEFFVKDDNVLVNEFAPRVHNTGHYTLDAATTSQFEQHLRAITGVELGDTSLLSYGGMVNILGLSLSEVPLDVLRFGIIYWYHKKEVRKRRKMGHINIVGRDLRDVETKISNVMGILYPNGVKPLI